MFQGDKASSGNAEFIWSSQDEQYVTVDQNGLVTGRMPGECVITGTVDGKTVTCNVKIMAVDPGKFINSDFVLVQ